MDEIIINITIMDKPYRLTVSRAEEGNVRKAASLINERIKAYARHYTIKDVQDLLAMTALQYATTAVKIESENAFNVQHLERKLKEIDELLDEQL